MAYFAVRSSPTHTATASKIIMPSNITSAGQLCLSCLSEVLLTDEVGLFHRQLKKSVSKTWTHPVKTISIYGASHFLCLWEAPHHECDYLYLEVPRRKPLCQCFQLMLQFDLNTFSFFSTCCICKHHFCNISFVVHCHCILYICLIHCQQPLLSVWFHHQHFPFSSAPRLKLNWVDKLCSLWALISCSYPLPVWDNKIITWARLSALLQLTVLFQWWPQEAQEARFVYCTLHSKDPS